MTQKYMLCKHICVLYIWGQYSTKVQSKGSCMLGKHSTNKVTPLHLSLKNILINYIQSTLSISLQSCHINTVMSKVDICVDVLSILEMLQSQILLLLHATFLTLKLLKINF